MKKMIKKEKGFTLVELLAVIAILAIIVAIAVPTVGNVIGESEKKAHDANIELIENAARLADVSGDYDTDGSISVSQLEDKGYLDEVPTVPGTETEYSGKVTKDGNGNFEYDGDESVD
ncbi:prepilin-type N-terminal cleavage/methylation domain-containing protein [Virgibacillus sp. JSM 102003]|uniref:prepilin-type N-terminal cleavage/methylation domain-containing protein n=1 Tax=Virgibacillus sp. JSM 102003 TaxID=1562108 RepID=UPI0035C269B4